MRGPRRGPIFSFPRGPRRGILNRMSHSLKLRCLCTLSLLLGLASLGCEHDEPASQDQPTPREEPPPAPKATTTKKIEVGKNVFLEIAGKKRRVLVKAAVCRRTDQLEQLLCRKLTKEHEAILAADVDARHIH